VLQVVPEDKVRKEPKDQQEVKVHKDQQVQLDHKEQLVAQVKQELKVIQGEQGHKVPKELKDQRDHHHLHVFQFTIRRVTLVISRVTSELV